MRELHGLFIDSGFSSELSLADSRKSRDGPIYAERSEGAYRIWKSNNIVQENAEYKEEVITWSTEKKTESM